MLNSAFELGEEINLTTIHFKLHRNTWFQYNDLLTTDLNINNWTTIKYLSDDGTSFHPDVDTIPNNRGGLYLFSIHCPIIPGRTEFPAYIGRAQLTDNQNLRKRCKEYFQKFVREEERPKITRLFKYWKQDIHLSFITLEDNDLIMDFEKKLINSLLLPFNDKIPDIGIQPAVRAFEN